MDLQDLREWFQDLETRDRWQLAGLLCGAAILLIPWRKDLTFRGIALPAPGALTSIQAPASGTIRTFLAERGRMVEPGEPLFSYLPPRDGSDPYGRPAVPGGLKSQGIYGPASGFPPRNYGGNAYASTAFQEEEKKIREKYRLQIAEATTFIVSDQEQLSRIYREQGPGRQNGSAAYDIQVAQNALARAQQVPSELGRKQEQELSALRAQYDSDNRAIEYTQASLGPPAARVPAGTSLPGEVTVLADTKALVWSASIRPGAPVEEGQACLSLLPEGAALEISTAVPAELAKELRQGASATLEILRWMHDADTVSLQLERFGNRNLERDEVLALVPGAARDTPFILVTFRPQNQGGPLFPPPGNCRVHVSGARRCLLQRWLF